MPHSRDNGKIGQAAFEFDASQSPRAAPAPEIQVMSSEVTGAISAPVVMLADRRRARHLEVVRRLLAETGVFRAD